MSASNTRFAAVLGAANFLVCAVVGTVLLVVTGSEGQTVQSVSGTGAGYESSAPATTTSPSTPGSVGENLETVSGLFGLSTVVPQGWPSKPIKVGFQAADPADGSHYVRYGADVASGDLMRAHAKAEKDGAADNLPGLHRLRMDRIDVRGSEAVDWEFTWESPKDGTRHVRAVYWRTGGVEYFVYVSALDSAWQPMPELLGTMVDRSRP